MVVSKSMTIVAACLAVAGGTASGLCSAAPAGAAVRSVHQDLAPHDDHGQAGALAGRSLGVNHNDHRVRTRSRFNIVDVGDNTNISRQVRIRERADGAQAAAGGGG
jgi:hypothetical protein